MYALTTLRAPGTLSPGYFRGDYVPDAVAQSWKLVEGEDVQADPIDDSGDSPAVPRPADDTDAGEWRRFVIARGTDPDEAALMSLEELMDAYPERDAAEGGTVERPADSAKKSEWVDYVIATGADEDWARADSTTKADLQAFEPGGAQRTTDAAADQGNDALGA
jgi:hypothetical protein